MLIMVDVGRNFGRSKALVALLLLFFTLFLFVPSFGQNYALYYSPNPEAMNFNPSYLLDGATGVAGPMYVFLWPETDVDNVTYYFEGDEVNVENNAPYELFSTIVHCWP